MADEDKLPGVWPARCTKCNIGFTAPPKNWDCPTCATKLWEPDDNATCCLVCKESVAKFTRHHCRLCGRVVCKDCSKYEQPIAAWGPEKQRCCRNCFVPSGVPVFKGNLKKLGQRRLVFGDAFKQRWFELHEGVLLYYKEPNGDLLGRIDLENARVVDVVMHRHAFCIMGPLLIRAFVFSADNEETKRRWWDAIEKCCVSANPSSPRTNTAPTASDASALLDGESEKLFQDGKSEVSLRDFELQTVLGLGSFGRVMKVREKSNGRILAMKILEKAQIVANKMVTHTQAEKSILAEINHPFIVKLHYAFQTKHHLVFVMDFLSGGELFFHLQKSKRFPESRAKFYCAEIGLALEYIHSKNIIYRDLKPENLVLDRDGHCVLTDFGLAKKDIKDVTHTFCGTPEYMSPELILKKGHTKAVDWWSLGIFLYEMVYGLPPFYTQNVSDMYEMILSKPLQFPPFFSPELKSLLQKLL
eukprot:PhF_6_TR12593/c0_g1_i1/m.19840/K13303/SGK2; serum/glucocorticoid-regulated kinase 2